MGGGFAVDNATLTRFFTFHFLFPFIVAAAVIVHLLFLHQTGSNNPLGLPNKLGGVVSLVLSIAILLILPFTHKGKFRSLTFYPINQIIFWMLVTIVFLLT